MMIFQELLLFVAVLLLHIILLSGYYQSFFYCKYTIFNCIY